MLFHYRPDVEKEGIWLIAPLISKLHTSVQGKVLKASGNVLETGNNFWSAKTAKEKEKNLQKRYSFISLKTERSSTFSDHGG